LAPNPFVLVPLDSLTLICPPFWMGAIFQYGRKSNFLFLKYFFFLKSPFYNMVAWALVFKYNLTLKSAIFNFNVTFYNM
jgi:hypothetical protein